MRIVRRFEVGDGSNSWLWLVAAVCFGPLTLVLLLGVLALPLWFAMLAELLARPEHFAHDPGATVRNVAVPIAYVISGLVGLAGLVRVLTLPDDERPRSHRVFTIGMIAVGLAALLVFNLRRIADLPEGLLSAGSLVYVALPFAGTIWLLAGTWRRLLAGRTP